MSDDSDKAGRAIRFLSAHPWITGIFSVCVLLGAAAGAVGLSEDFSLARRIAAGAVAGAGFAMLVMGPKLMVR
jgi:hypothetical protein